ncbi:MAG: ABC transporter substrate-binding protein [Kofleriaceae bacterium]
MRWLALVCLLACGEVDRAPRWQPGTATVPRRGGTLRIATPNAISTLDPTRANEEISIIAIHAIVEGLVGYKGDTIELEERLASKLPDISQDGLVYRFVLRADLRYGDGDPILASDFKRAFEEVLRTPDSLYATKLLPIAGAQDYADKKAETCTGIVASDADRTLEIRITEPTATFLNDLAIPFAAPLSERQAKLDPSERRTHPLASGPFELVEWDEGHRVELRRRAYYYEPKRQYLDGIVLLENVPRELQFLMFDRGGLDAIERMSAPDQLWVTSQPAWTPYVRTLPMLYAFGSRMNTTKWPFKDLRVRQAFNYAVNKSHITKLLTGTAVASHGVLPPGAFGRDDTLQPYPHDPVKARKLLADAGIPDGLTLTYVTLEDEEALKLAASLQSDLAEVGVRIEISVMSLGEWGAAIGKEDGPSFSLATWSGEYADPRVLLEGLFHSREIATTMNSSFYNNPTLDKILDEARAMPRDSEERAAKYREAEQILYDDAPWIWGYHQTATEVIQPYVHGFGSHPIWIRDYTSTWLDDKVPR